MRSPVLFTFNIIFLVLAAGAAGFFLWLGATFYVIVAAIGMLSALLGVYQTGRKKPGSKKKSKERSGGES
ncbi:hypothetical protein CHL76_15500 [Marinococcus halophilus]|uniref:Uncharacterized protein n=1 Tax=Marinococcus halophilus TaxID=1371 RepID=A0A510Y9S0_MARHA|nr:hypothetical protein [Marinococcus halophilus]OZT78930.1 hypothetical protein CHL76_15500 [Marinococcus halophilus]GEK60098.1 hypothetical protein MHA01_30030 [Marinococcus halophilus]